MSKETSLELVLNFGPDGKTSIPVVTQDSKSKQVLLLAYVNKEAFEKTIQTGYATYWSRSRNCLWTKGETSGDKLKIKDILINCEQNSLLYLVEPARTNTCHTGRKSCFYRRIKNGKLEFI